METKRGKTKKYNNNPPKREQPKKKLETFDDSSDLEHSPDQRGDKTQ